MAVFFFSRLSLAIRIYSFPAGLRSSLRREPRIGRAVIIWQPYVGRFHSCAPLGMQGTVDLECAHSTPKNSPTIPKIGIIKNDY